MTAMTVPQPTGRDRDEILAALVTAETLIRSEQLAEAAALYQSILIDTMLDDIPTARTEVFANYGALLLHKARSLGGSPEAQSHLERAIDMLSRARKGYQLGQGEGSSAISDTNLALAYYQRFTMTDHGTDLMSAHMALDGAEAAALADSAAQDKIDWIRSIRDMLVEQVDRRREPR